MSDPTKAASLPPDSERLLREVVGAHNQAVRRRGLDDFHHGEQRFEAAIRAIAAALREPRQTASDTTLSDDARKSILGAFLAAGRLRRWMAGECTLNLEEAEALTETLCAFAVAAEAQLRSGAPAPAALPSGVHDLAAIALCNLLPEGSAARDAMHSSRLAGMSLPALAGEISRLIAEDVAKLALRVLDDGDDCNCVVSNPVVEAMRVRLLDVRRAPAALPQNLEQVLAEHRYHGISDCSCGWLDGDYGFPEEHRQRHEAHLAGVLRAAAQREER